MEITKVMEMLNAKDKEMREVFDWREKVLYHSSIKKNEFIKKTMDDAVNKVCGEYDEMKEKLNGALIDFKF